MAELRRTMGLFQVTASGIGIIVGAGIYVLIGSAAGLAGPRVWMSFVMAALLSVFTGLSYAELASMYPRAGGEYEYARHVFPNVLSFMVGWLMICALIVGAGAVSLGFGRYLGYFAPVTQREGAAIVLALVALVALLGIKHSAMVTTSLSLLQVGGLVFVVVAGVSHVGDVNLLSGGGHHVGGIMSAAALVFFAFIGFDEVITLAEETHNPSRTVPLALLFALGISTLLYVMVAIVAVSVVDAHALGHSVRPLADVLNHLLHGRGEGIVSAIALVATTNTSLMCTTAASRLQFAMARTTALPARLAQLGDGNQVPSLAILIAVFASFACAMAGNLQFVASVTNFGVYATFISVNVAVIVLRRTDSSRPRPFRVRGVVQGVPVLPVLGLVSIIAFIPALQFSALMAGLAVCALGLGFYGLLHMARLGPRHL